MKIGASHTLSLTPLPLTSPSPTLHRWVPSHSSRPYLAPTVRKVGRQSLTTRSSSMLSSARVADPAFSRAGALDVRYLAAAGAGVRKHKPYSKQRRLRLWSKPVNVRTCELQLRLVLDPIVMYMPSVRADTLVSRPGLLSTNCKHLSTICRQKNVDRGSNPTDGRAHPPNGCQLSSKAS